MICIKISASKTLPWHIKKQNAEKLTIIDKYVCYYSNWVKNKLFLHTVLLNSLDITLFNESNFEKFIQIFNYKNSRLLSRIGVGK